MRTRLRLRERLGHLPDLHSMREPEKNEPQVPHLVMTDDDARKGVK